MHPGGSSNQASSLLAQTFKPHSVRSGVLDVSFTLKPSGSTTLKGPITISFGGPFQTLGTGHLPQSNFTISLSAVGTSISLGILSTGTNGYVTLQGTSYQLPAATFQKLARRFNLIIDTISAPHDYNAYLGMLRPSGALVLVGIPPEPTPLAASSLVNGNKRFAGSMIGGIRETQEMLDYCAAHEIAADVEVIPIQKINEAYERMLRNDVHYRFVIDIASLA